MKRLVDIVLDARPALIGSAGTGATMILDRINVVVGILVGLATLVYLVVRIRKELQKE